MSFQIRANFWGLEVTWWVWRMMGFQIKELWFLFFFLFGDLFGFTSQHKRIWWFDPLKKARVSREECKISGEECFH